MDQKKADLLCVGDGICFIYNHCLKQHSVKTKHCTRHQDYGASMEITQFANSKVSMLAGYLRIFLNAMFLQCKSYF